MKKYVKTTAIFLSTVFLITSCSKDNESDVSTETYNTTFKVTDAPIDNADVEAVFVTVTDVKVDGQSLEGFNATTVNLKALTDGQTETLGSLALNAKSYSSLELVLDYDMDAAGNEPGCYVEMADGSKDKISAAANTIAITDSFEVIANATNEVVMDFDLRKTIKEEGSVSSDFEFVTMAELSAGIRTVNTTTTGTIEGTVDQGQQDADRIVVYAYEKGTFNAETETQGQGSSNITFANAVTSAEVKGLANTYSLNFLEEGEYELVFVAYNKNPENEFKFNSVLQAESTTGLNLGAIQVTSALQVAAHVTITGSL